MPELLHNIFHFAFISCLTFFPSGLSAAIRKLIYSYIDAQDDNETKRKQARGLIIIINVIITIAGIVFLADNLGYNVTTLIAGMGIGGIAIALAAQNEVSRQRLLLSRPRVFQSSGSRTNDVVPLAEYLLRLLRIFSVVILLALLISGLILLFQ